MPSAIAAPPPALCWICRKHPAGSGEHRFKASDLRARAPGLAQDQPLFLQRGRATNDRIISAKSRALKYPDSMCLRCNDTLSAPYDRDWQTLSEFLAANWDSVFKRGAFELVSVFPGRTESAALNVHLFFVKLFGCKIHEGGVPIDLAPSSQALLGPGHHPEISLTVCADHRDPNLVAALDTPVDTWQHPREGVHYARWSYALPPFAVQVHYIKAGTPLRPPGHLWRAGHVGTLVNLSAYLDSGVPPSFDPANP